MSTEPSNADPAKRKRRWLQFSLRSLMIGVTLFCVVVGGYVGWQKRIVSERLALRDELRGLPGSNPSGIRGRVNRINPDDGRYYISWLRTKFGDYPYGSVELPLGTPKEYRAYVRKVFPEALVSSFKKVTMTSGRIGTLAVRFPDEPAPPDDSDDWLPPP
jgi:hypothetical protein